MSVGKVKKFIKNVQDRGIVAPRLVLSHVNVNYRREAIWNETIDGSSVDEVASQIYIQAKEHAGGMHAGLQHYTVSAYDPAAEEGETNIPVASTAFKIEPPMASDDEAAASEPATGQGLLAQLMRHNQEMHRQSNHAMGTLTYHLARTVEKQADQIEKLMADRIGTIEVMEELMSRKHERDITAKQADAKIVRDKEMWEKLVQLFPVVVNKISGKEIVRQKDTVLESVVMQFMETVDPKTLDRISESGVLNPQQMILFGTILEQVTKRMIALSEKAEQQKTAQDAAMNMTKKDDDKEGGGSGGTPAAA